MTIKDKKELVDILTSRLFNDIDKVLDGYEDDIYDMFNFDNIMTNIIKKQGNIKTLNDVFDLIDYYDKLKDWYRKNEIAYIYSNYQDREYIETLIKLDLKSATVTHILDTFKTLRETINNEIKNINTDFLFKEFYDWVDKYWGVL